MRALALAVASVLLIASPAVAAPDANEPPGSSRSEFFTIALDETFVISADLPGTCPFPIVVDEIGWVRFHVVLDQEGWVFERATWHIDYLMTANGTTLRNPFYRTTYLHRDRVIENGDGTTTIVVEWSGIASHAPHLKVGDIGHVTFSLTFDASGELAFTVLSSSGQLTGDWSHGPEVLCEAFGP